MTSRSLSELLAPVRVLLLDFDGPVCSVFAGYPARVIAEELHDLAAGFGAVPTGFDGGSDPVTFLQALAVSASPSVLATVADALRHAEVTAVASAKPTPGVDRLLRAAHEHDRRVAIVSNNSTAAIHAYLNQHELSSWVEVVVAREDRLDPRLLKPDPHLVRVALSALDVQPPEAVFVGDSASDVLAGRAVGVHVIGYANKPGKREDLTNDDWCGNVVASLDELTAALAL